MKKTIVLALLFHIQFFSNAQSSFDILIRSQTNDSAFGDIIETTSSNFILSTTQRSDWFSKYWAQLYKINYRGDIMQSLTIKKDSSCSFYKLHQKNENEILCIGGIMNRNGPPDVWIACIDTSLNLLWEKTINTTVSNEYYIYSIQSVDYDESEKIIAVGLEKDFSTRYTLMLRINQNGDSLYSKYIGPSTTHIFDLMKTPSTNQLLLPVMGLNQQTYSRGQIIILDTVFNMLQVDSIPGRVANCCTVKPLNDSVYFLAGNKYYSFSTESINVALVKMKFPNAAINSAIVGRPADTVDFGGTFQSMDFFNPSNIYLAGTSNISLSEGYYANQPSWYLISQFDSTLTPYWTKYYGGDAYYVLQTITATSDGGAIVAGTRFDYINHPENKLDVYVLKIDSNGIYTSLDEKQAVAAHDAIVYPNPGSEYLVVQSGVQIKGAIFRMFDMQGRQVMEQRLTSTMLRLSTGNLGAGNYPWQIIFNNKVIEGGKWIKEK